MLNQCEWSKSLKSRKRIVALFVIVILSVITTFTLLVGHLNETEPVVTANYVVSITCDTSKGPFTVVLGL